MIHDGTFADVTRISAQEVFADSQVSAASDLMRELGFGAYRDVTGGLLIGSKASDMPDHRRWFATLTEPKASFQTGGWTLLDGTCQEINELGDATFDIFQELVAHFKMVLQAHGQLLRQHSLTRDIDWLSNFYQVFGHLNTNVIAGMYENIDWRGAHELLCHFDIENDLPVELLMRMHGILPHYERYGFWTGL